MLQADILARKPNVQCVSTISKINEIECGRISSLIQSPLHIKKRMNYQDHSLPYLPGANHENHQTKYRTISRMCLKTILFLNAIKFIPLLPILINPFYSNPFPFTLLPYYDTCENIPAQVLLLHSSICIYTECKVWVWLTSMLIMLDGLRCGWECEWYRTYKKRILCVGVGMKRFIWIFFLFFSYLLSLGVWRAGVGETGVKWVKRVILKQYFTYNFFLPHKIYGITYIQGMEHNPLEWLGMSWMWNRWNELLE